MHACMMQASKDAQHASKQAGRQAGKQASNGWMDGWMEGGREEGGMDGWMDVRMYMDTGTNISKTICIYKQSISRSNLFRHHFKPW